ncbi:MAG: hypothetical protein ACOCXQ_03500 [Patescibacteria group bacterium]
MDNTSQPKKNNPGSPQGNQQPAGTNPFQNMLTVEEPPAEADIPQNPQASPGIQSENAQQEFVPQPIAASSNTPPPPSVTPPVGNTQGGNNGTKKPKGVPVYQDKPRINPTLAIIGIGLFVVGSMMGFFIGRSSAPRQQAASTAPEPTVAEQQTEEALPMQPADTGELEMVPIVDAEDFVVDLPQPQNCDNCIQSEGDVFRVISKGTTEAMPGDDAMMVGTGEAEAMQTSPPSIDDWAFTVTRITSEDLPLAEKKGTVPPGEAITDLWTAENGETVVVTDPETGEEITFTRGEDSVVSGYEARTYISDVTRFGTGNRADAIFQDDDGVVRVITYEWISEEYDQVFDAIVNSFTLTTGEDMMPGAMDGVDDATGSSDLNDPATSGMRQGSEFTEDAAIGNEATDSQQPEEPSFLVQ